MYRALLSFSLWLATACASAAAPAVEAPVKSCKVDSECAANELCYSTGCKPALSGYFSFTFVKGHLESYGDDGKPWHPNPELPDPYATIGIAGKVLCKSETAKSTLEPIWTTNCTINLRDGDTVLLQIHDAKGNPMGSMMTKTMSATEFVTELRTISGDLKQQDSLGTLFYKLKPM